MAESSEDIESGCDPLKSALCGEMVTIKLVFNMLLDQFQCSFKPGRRPKSAESGSHRLNSPKEASPDKILRNIAFILAVIEKAASTLGTMNFIWATVVLLGGFSQSLKSIDFWFVNVILVVEGLRILGRQGELKTQVMAWRSSSPDFMILLVQQYSVVVQEYSAIACIVLSSLRIHKQQYGGHDNRNRNRNRALNLFYWLSVVESSLTMFAFLARFSVIEASQFSNGSDGPKREINFVPCLDYSALKEVGLLDYSRRFMYDTYCRCMNGSVFDGLKMDFLSYSVELLLSIDDNNQLEGARVLSVLVRSDWLPSEKLRLIGTTPGALERLIDLLSWEKPEEQEIRRAAGEIICKLVEIPGNRIRVRAIPEYKGSIKSMLYDSDQIETHSRKYPGQPSDEYNYSNFSVLGRQILIILDNDPDNRAEMGTSKELLSKIPELPKLNSDASEIVRHLEITPMETPENITGISGFGAEHSDDPNS